MVPSSTLPEDVRRCVDNSNIVVEPDLVDLALGAVSRVREDSELKELWDESQYAEEMVCGGGRLRNPTQAIITKPSRQNA